MLARLSSSKQGEHFPQDWQEGLSRLLNESYKQECKKHQHFFDVYGQIYPEELLLIVSWISDSEASATPITCFLSCGPEHLGSEKKVKQTQSDYIDIVGLLFDEIFAQEEWSEFEPDWQEIKYKETSYFYKISRENINLTLEANRLLGEDFNQDD